MIPILLFMLIMFTILFSIFPAMGLAAASFPPVEC